MSLLEVVYILVHYARTQDSLIHITSRPLATRYLAHCIAIKKQPDNT
jgi:hypothetical protein